MLALAHIRAILLRLCEGHPDIAGKALVDDFAPPQQDIDAPVRLAAMPQGQRGQALFGDLRTPRLVPRSHAQFQISNDPDRARV